MANDGSAERSGRQPEREAGHRPGRLRERGPRDADDGGRTGGRWWHAVSAWLAGTACGYALASVAHTQTVLAGLVALGVDVPLGTRLATTGSDLVGLWRYAVVIGIGFALGLATLRILPLPLSRPVRGVLAGTLAVATALLAMRLALSFTPIASARDPIGFALQCLSGTAAGLVWAGVGARLAARPFAGRPSPS